MQTGVRRGRPGHDLESVLRGAVKVFNERGYDGTSMEDLSRELGITKSAIYHHVPGKEELLRLAVDRALDGLFAVLDEISAMEAPAIARLEELARRSVLLLVAELPFVTLLLRVRGNTKAERRALARRRSFDAAVADLVSQARDEGDLRPDVDPALAARLLYGMINSVVEWYRQPGRRPGELADSIVAVAFGGLRRSVPLWRCGFTALRPDRGRWRDQYVSGVGNGSICSVSLFGGRLRPGRAQRAGADRPAEDDAIVTALYQQYREPLMTFVLRLTAGNRAQAEDVVQETMLRAWREAGKLDLSEPSLMPWLTTVARRIVIDDHRRRQARPIEMADAELANLPAEDHTAATDRRLVVADALRALSPLHRQVLNETILRDRTVNQAAEVLGVPVGTVKSRVYYALRALQVVLAERGVPP